MKMERTVSKLYRQRERLSITGTPVSVKEGRNNFSVKNEKLYKF